MVPHRSIQSPLYLSWHPQELLRAFMKALPLFIIFLAMQHGLNLVSIYLGGMASIIIIWVLEYAYYSKHQYIYSRTTWQGIRFNLKGRRVAYANLAFVLFFKSLFTLGCKWQCKTAPLNGGTYIKKRRVKVHHCFLSINR